MAIPHVDERSVKLHAPATWLPTVRRLAIAAVAFGGGFALAGFSEQWSLIQILVLLTAAVWFRHEAFWIALAGTIAGFGVVMIAPGNAVRSASLAEVGARGLTFLEAAQMALYQSALLIGQTLVYRFYAVVPVLIVGYIAGHGQRVRNRSLWILATFAGAFALIVVSILPVLLVTGVMSYRGFTGATFILVVGCALMGYLVACRDSVSRGNRV